MQGASLQCMQATEMDFSPGMPSFKVTTRRRFTPQGTSCSFLHAVTQPLHSMQRSASQTNFIRAISISSNQLRTEQSSLRVTLGLSRNISGLLRTEQSSLRVTLGLSR